MIKFPPKRIIVAYDLSDVSRKAWRHAVALAATCGAVVEAVYVEPWMSGVDMMPPPGLTPAVVRPLRASIRAAIGAGPKISILEGDPAQRVLDLARRRHADMIVVGTRGRKGLARVLLGSTAEAVVRGASVPVLVARGPVRPVRAILAPVNFTPYSDYGFSYAAGAAAVLAARMTALHVNADPIWEGNPRYRLSNLIHRLPKTILQRCRPTAEEVTGEPVAQILKEEGAYDWLVLVAHEKSLLKDAFIGTTVERVLRHSSIPVLCVPAPRRALFALQSHGGAAR